MIQPRYRQDYTGEFVILNTDIRRGIKQQRREWIDNPIINQHISDRAAVIGSAVDRDRFDYARLQRHRGGLQGKKRLQTYASSGIWQHLRLDFYVSTDRVDITRLHESEYKNRTTIYSNTRLCMMYPGSFYPVPYQPAINDIAAAVYLAAFDGHKEIFLLGYTNDTAGNTKNWKKDVADVIGTYSTHEFYLVGTESNMPDQFRQLPNVTCQDYRKFVTYCDI